MIIDVTSLMYEIFFVVGIGEGAPYNPAIAHRLVKELARHGVAEFQADMGTFYSLGLEPVAPNEYGNLFILKEQDHDLSMLHLTFAAKSGDATARMALGFRHLHVCFLFSSCPCFDIISHSEILVCTSLVFDSRTDIIWTALIHCRALGWKGAVLPHYCIMNL